MTSKEAQATVVNIVRHGNVENPNEIFYGRQPGFHLSEYGCHEVMALAEYLQQNYPNIVAIYTSPMERTLETSMLIQERFEGIFIQSDNRLIEVKTPREGRPRSEFFDDNFNFFRPEDIANGGESIPDLLERVHDAVTDIVNQHPGQEVLVVTHGDLVMLMRAKYKGEPISFQSIRDGYYVHTADGVRIVFTSTGTEVSDIIPPDSE